VPGETGRFVLIPSLDELGGRRNCSKGISWSGAREQQDEFRKDFEDEEEGIGDIIARNRKGKGERPT